MKIFVIYNNNFLYNRDFLFELNYIQNLRFKSDIFIYIVNFIILKVLIYNAIIASIRLLK